MCGFNKARRLWIIVEGVAELTNCDFEDAIADKRFRPAGVEKFLFGDELAWMPEEIGEHCEGFGSELNCLCASTQALVGQVQIKRIEDYASFQLHSVNSLTEILRQVYDLQYGRDYCPLMMEGWQYRGAFVIQFRPESDIEAGRFEGRVEHVASYKAMRFHSLDELLAFIASVLAEVSNAEQQ